MKRNTHLTHKTIIRVEVPVNYTPAMQVLHAGRNVPRKGHSPGIGEAIGATVANYLLQGAPPYELRDEVQATVPVNNTAELKHVWVRHAAQQGHLKAI